MKVMLVEDHPIYLDGLTSLIEASGMHVVATATSTAAALAITADVEPDVVVIDIALPDGDGVDLTTKLLAQRPGLRVLILTMFTEDAVVARALEAGASGYLVKDAPPQEILAAIHAIASGSLVIGSALANRLRDRAADGVRRAPEPPASTFPDLRYRERQVLGLVAEGLDNAAIAARLGLSTKTVANYISAILTQLQLPNRAAARDIVRTRRTQET